MIQCQVGCACPTPWCGMHISFFYISFLQYLTSTPYQVLFVSLLSCLQFSALASTLTWLLRSSGLLATRDCLEEVLALVWPGRRWCCYLSYNTSSSSSFLGWMLLFCLFDHLLRIWIVFSLDYCEKGCFGCGSSNNFVRTFRLIFANSETIVESCINYVGNFLLQKLSWEFHIYPFRNFPDLPPASYPHSSVPFFSPS